MKKRERGNETETGTETGEHVEATQTAVTPVELQTGRGADPGTDAGQGAGTGNANGAGKSNFIMHIFM